MVSFCQKSGASVLGNQARSGVGFCIRRAIEYGIKEVPVTKIYPAKELGYTKMKPITGWWNILKPIIYLGLRI